MNGEVNVPLSIAVGLVGLLLLLPELRSGWEWLMKQWWVRRNERRARADEQGAQRDREPFGD